MTVYNKLKIAILAIIASQSVSAIQLDPIQIQSGSGDLLYAEMKFSNSNPNEKIDVNLATAEDMINVRASQQAPGHLNFFTRRSGDGSGVIVITSTRPIIEPELNILLKIQEGNATYIQQVRANLTRTKSPATPMAMPTNEKSLIPQVIVSEKDIALNLPESTLIKATVTENTATKANAVTTAPTSTPLAISTAPLPLLNTAIAATTNAQPSTTIQNAPITAKENTASPSTQVTRTANTNHAREDADATRAAFLKQHSAITPKAEIAQPKPEQKIQQTTAQNQNQNQNQQNSNATQQAKVTATSKEIYKVQANESLWKIASKIAARTHQSVPEVMRQLQANNPEAFIQGDPNRLRQGVALNLVQPMPNTQQKFKPAPPTTQQAPSGKTRYRLNQAEMSIVVDQKSSQDSSTTHTNSLQKTTSAELSTKVMTAREKTVKLQNNVTQLNSALNQKNNRIQLLNARLAQIQQQLQQQAQAKKPK
ncbi:FimV family protein [Acinetobacter sp. Marseille-Q1618]|uniref:type IV pilus assembly protein FimV n=1 Tax=Acinetobacter sp. Marseille-Q1618 TaxID=2697502 RepID=UPI001570DCF7|nr:hypothetical protein [Acinetobacter sp. Marseille-Q1618]